MAIIFGIGSTKGGPGKTTLCANLGAFIADQDKRVLMIDTDKQAALSGIFPLDYQAPEGLTRLIQHGNTNDTISQTNIDGLDLIYSDDSDGLMVRHLEATGDGVLKLKAHIEPLKSQYDYILIDTQGEYGLFLHAAAMAADYLISPLAADTLTLREYHKNMQRVLTQLKTYERLFKYPPPKILVALSLIQNTIDSNFITESVRNYDFPSNTCLLTTEIPLSTVYKGAITHRVPVHVFDPEKKDKPKTGFAIMKSLFDEISAVIEADLSVVGEKS